MSQDKRAEDRFDGLLGEMRSTIDAEIREELAIIDPDFPAIVDELRRRDDDGHLGADATPELSSVWGAGSQGGCGRSDGYGLDSVVVGAEEADDRLSDLVADARQEIEADLAARRLLPVPPLFDRQRDLDERAAGSTAPPPVSEPSPAKLRWLGAALAIAASVALLWSLGPSLAQPLLGGSPTASQAQWSERGDAEAGQASRRAPDPERHRSAGRRRSAPASSSGPTGELLETSAEDRPVDEAMADERSLDGAPLDPRDDADTSAEDRDRPHADSAADRGVRKVTAKKRTPPDLDALEAEAEALWRSGDRAGAEALLRTIIRRSQTRRRADLAYGDLFTITRQLYGREREAAVWREYLARFPRGRYADDARAGLCRRESAGEAARCWSRYLLDFPSGTHRDEAKRTTDAD